MEGLLLHGGGGGGGEEIACGSVESYGVYSVLYTCGLLLRVGLPCGPLLECVYLHRVLCVKKRTTRHLRCCCLFSEGNFSGRSNPMVFTLLSTPDDCSCAMCLLMLLRIKSRKAWFLRCVGWFSEGDFSTMSFKLRCPFFHVPSRHVTLTVWGGRVGGGYVRNKHTGYCAPCRLVFSIIVSKSEPPITLHPKPYALSSKPQT